MVFRAISLAGILCNADALSNHSQKLFYKKLLLVQKGKAMNIKPTHGRIIIKCFVPSAHMNADTMSSHYEWQDNKQVPPTDRWVICQKLIFQSVLEKLSKHFLLKLYDQRWPVFYA